MRLIFERPAFTCAEAEEIAESHFGVAGRATELDSERDRNFLLTTESGARFVLKVANGCETRDQLDFENSILDAVRRAVPESPQVLAATRGGQIVTERDHLIRLLTFVEGRPMARIRPHDSPLLESLGRCLARTDAALLPFEHPAAARKLKWDLASPGWIREYIPQIPSTEERDWVKSVLDRAEAGLLTELKAMRHSVIHNDANDHNVIAAGAAGSGRHIVSLIDYGDAMRAPTICELAIACAYAMLGKEEPLRAAVDVTRGYNAVLSLEEREVEVLYDLICLRLAVSLANAALQRRESPGNDYLTVSEAPVRALIARLQTIHPRFALGALRDACGWNACASSASIMSWLDRHRDQLSPPVAGWEPGRVHVIDLSMSSPELHFEEFADVARLTRRLDELVLSAHKSIGFGRYDEARPLYTSSLFRTATNDGPEWRTVHIGVDVFMPPGTEVLAAMQGVVHSMQCNDAKLDYGPTLILRHELPDGQSFYTLYGHLSRASIKDAVPGRSFHAGEPVARIGGSDENGGWPPHVHFQVVMDLFGRSGEFPGVASPECRSLWKSISPDPGVFLGMDETAGVENAADRIEERRRSVIGPSLSLSYRKPLHIVRGHLQHLYDDAGRKYLDCVNNVAHVGHCHPRVVRAGQRQMAVLNTNTRYLHGLLVDYAEKLCSTLPDPLRVCFLVCSGSEANELALRLAWHHSGSRHTVVVDSGYHGNTSTLVDISPYKFDGPGGSGPPTWVQKIPMPDEYRGPFRGIGAGERYAAAIGDAVDKGERPGAFICESILSCGGQIVLPDGFLKSAYGRIRSAGGICIADEVQTGFGRCGNHFWAFELQGVVPDIVTMGKPIGNGHPMGAVVTTPEIARSFANGMEYFNTFGGNPVSCAIGLEVLRVIDDESLQANAKHAGNVLMAELRRLQDRYAIIGDVRGHGLFIGIELVEDRDSRVPAARTAGYIVNRMRERGVLLSTDGPLHNVIKIKPPMTFNGPDVDQLASNLEIVLDEDACQVSPA